MRRLIPDIFLIRLAGCCMDIGLWLTGIVHRRRNAQQRG